MTRLAAGRARALGLPTRGTTAPERLRRADRWLTGTQPASVRRAALAVDLGFGSSPVTTLEWAARLRAVAPDVVVVGLEIDPARVAAARRVQAPPGVSFGHGGFELGGHRPGLVRAMNVLRQYEEAAVAPAWSALTAGGASLLEGTCDEIGRRAAWVWVEPAGPVSLTLAAHTPTVMRPSALAERLPKVLIHRNVPGEPVHALLLALDDAWDRAAAVAPFGPRQRWAAMCATVARDWPVIGGPRRWRLGELTVRWDAVAPTH